MVRGLFAEALATSPHEPRIPKQALRLPAAAVVALERLVIDELRPMYHRLMAWFRLLKVWCSLRSDDHRGLLPSEVHVGERGLSAVLSRTKTSGPDKRVQTLQIWVSPDAFLVEPFWLRTGWALWARQGLDRD